MEEHLGKGCKKGDRLAQKRLYEKYYGRMMAVCLRYGSDRDEAADIPESDVMNRMKIHLLF